MRREALVRLLLSGLCFALAAVARLSPDVCVWYADRVFPAVRQAFCALNEAFPAWPALALGLLCAAIFARRQFFTHLPGRLLSRTDSRNRPQPLRALSSSPGPNP